MWEVLYVGLSVIAGLVTLWAGYIAIADWRVSRRLERIKHFPVKIRRSVSFSNYTKTLRQLAKHIDTRRQTPQIVVGVHYGGLASAADLAKEWFVPVMHVETRFAQIEGVTVCQQVLPKFPLSELNGKDILIVDNSINSGGTLRMTVDTLRPHAQSVNTCVIYKKQRNAGAYHTPNYIAFSSEGPLDSLLK